MVTFPINLALGSQVFNTGIHSDHIQPYHFAVLTFDVVPTAGTASVTVDPGTGVYYSASDTPTAKLTNGMRFPIVGPAVNIGIVLSGVTGGSGAKLHLFNSKEWFGPGLPEGIFRGLRAITTQPYTEANVKNGVQYFARAYWDSANQIPAGATRYAWVQTGAKKILVKLRELHYSGEEFQVNLYANPTGVTGGTVIPIRNYNAVNPVATTVQAKQDVAIVTPGTLFDGPEWFFGSAGAAQRAGTTIPQGRERVLPANTQFLVAFTTSAGTGNTRIQYFLDWYEGDTDF